jgi:hypothetical protein
MIQFEMFRGNGGITKGHLCNLLTIEILPNDLYCI